MKYFNAIKNFQLINAINEITLPFNNQARKSSQQSKSSTHSQRSQENWPDAYAKGLDYQESQNFILMLRSSRNEIASNENKIKRKIQIFDQLHIEPVYFDPISHLKILSFQFQLGSDIFLDRTEALYTQVAQINTAIKRILSNSIDTIFIFFQLLHKYNNIIDESLARIKKLRSSIQILRKSRVFIIVQKMKARNVIKQKLRLLDKVKKKKQIAFKNIQNIDQAFFTEQNRVKLYKKIKQLTQLQKCRYVETIKNKLIQTSKRNVLLVEEGLQRWLKGCLSLKQIQKLVFMIYFVERQDIYKENEIRISYRVVSQEKLRKEILKILQWTQFHYMQNLMTIKQRIHEFIHYLASKMQ